MEKTVAIELKGITKTFGEVVANKNVDLDVKRGEILSILGENGSGKTTLMNMIAGIYFPDEGQIFIDGKEVVIKSPKDAFAHNIGMIHQHFKLVDVLSAADNIILGEKAPLFSVKAHSAALKAEMQRTLDIEYKRNESAESAATDKNTVSRTKFKYAMKIACLPFVKLGKKIKFNHLAKNRGEKLQKIADGYGFEIDLKKKIYELSVSEKQTVEIIKALYRGAEILILDEPTAVLTPQEIEKLFDVLRTMRDKGKAIIIITHKLNEVMAISDRVAVLRKGEHIATVNTSETNEQQLTEMMVGRKVELNIDRTEPHDVDDRLVVKHLTAVTHDGVKTLDDISFEARSGEILGIAGIAGSGQRQLLEAIAGLYKVKSGEIVYNDPTNESKPVDLRSKTPLQIRNLGVRLSFVPEDRLGMGLVGNMDLIDNMMLRSYRKGGLHLFLNRKPPKELAEKIVNELNVVTPSTHTAVRRLSGGNVQKVLVGREISSSPTVLMTAYPVRGLDINSSYTIYNLLNEQKEKGVAVIFVGEDLDVLIELCDRIMVICGGRVTGMVDARHANKNEVGLMMMGRKADEESDDRNKINDKEERADE